MIDEGANIALRDEEPGDRFLALPSPDGVEGASTRRSGVPALSARS